MTADVMTMRRLVGAYASEAKFEVFHLLRAPAMGIPFLLLPGPLYLFFGVMLAGASPEMRTNPDLPNYVFSGWCAFAAMGPAIFGVGCPLAVEREAGLLRLKRALPAPAGSYLIAKFVMAMAFASLAVGGVVVAALAAGRITLSPWEVAGVALVMIAGAMPFAAIGLCVGAFASGSSAPAFGNLVFMPMLYLSGLFFPLPGLLRSLVVIWPAFHLNQIALAVGGIDRFRFFDPTMSAAALAGVTVLFGGLAIRRLARVG